MLQLRLQSTRAPEALQSMQFRGPVHDRMVGPIVTRTPGRRPAFVSEQQAMSQCPMIGVIVGVAETTGQKALDDV